MDITKDELQKIAQERAAELREENLTLRRLIVAVDAFFRSLPYVPRDHQPLASAVATVASEADIAGPVISEYSRKEALKDGELVDVSGVAKEAGIKFNTAVTRALFETIQPSAEDKMKGQSFRGRLWDMLTVFKFKVRNATSIDEIQFTFSVACTDKTVEVPVKGICGPGDDRRPVITFMLAEED